MLSKNLPELKNFTEAELRDFALSIGEKAFRGTQIFRWISKGAKSFDDMSDIPQNLRNKLAESVSIGNIIPVNRQISREDGTEKILFELGDKNYIETVFMKYKYGNSLCISSQAGCRMGCEFCASGRLGLVRNLEAWEMFDQVIKVEEITGEKINHIVVMGTGEPFDNYENLSVFLELIHQQNGFNLSMRNITVSTCGLVPGILRFAKDFPQVNLAVSLHSSTDEARKKIMPIAKKYSLEELISACNEYIKMTNRRITFEYAVVKGINDSDQDIRSLITLLRGMNAHVNLIPLNDTKETFLSSSGRKRAKEIAEMLVSSGIQSTVRRSLGQDIDAACGQLRLKKAQGKI